MLAQVNALVRSTEYSLEQPSVVKFGSEAEVNSILFKIQRMAILGSDRFRQFEAWMVDSGYTKLGRGMYGAAWLSPISGKVIKTNFTLQGSQDGWWLWASKALEYKDNPYMPKVSFIKRHNDYYVAEVELLDSTDMYIPWKDGDPIMGTVHDTHHFMQLADILVDCRMLLDSTITRTEIEASMVFYFDLHQGNWMERAGQLVLNDPISTLRTNIQDFVQRLSNKGTLNVA